METLLAIAYTHLDKKSQPFKTNSIAIGTKELRQRKIYVKKHFFLQNGILKFVNRMNGGYKIIVCTPPPLCWGLNLQPNFQKRGAWQEYFSVITKNLTLSGGVGGGGHKKTI